MKKIGVQEGNRIAHQKILRHSRVTKRKIYGGKVTSYKLLLLFLDVKNAGV